jgi:hypothetical protein
LFQNKLRPDFFFAMKQKPGNTKSAPQQAAVDTNQTSTNESRPIAQEICAFAQSRSALLRRRQFLREQLACIDTALDATPARLVRQPGQKRHYGDLTAAVKQALESGALTKRAIVERLQAVNLLTEPNPLKVLDSVLYTPHFERAGKLFSLAKPIV